MEFSTASWKTPEIQLWPIPLVAEETSAAAFARLLSSSELDRANRYRREESKRAFILRTGAVRLLLGRYLDIPPSAIRFTAGQNGKPHVVSSGGVSFSLSHSAGLALVGITRGCEIGVDVEQVRDLSDWSGLIRAICSPEEEREMQVLPPDLQKRAFFECWTRKEAYLKARGWGLARDAQFPAQGREGGLANTYRNPGFRKRLRRVDPRGHSDDDSLLRGGRLRGFGPYPARPSGHSNC